MTIIDPEVRIQRLEKVNTRLEIENRDLKDKNRNLIRSFNVNPVDRWYLAYLQLELMRLEAQYAQLQDNYHLLAADHQKKSKVTMHFTLVE